jgi:hypothetical protein
LNYPVIFTLTNEIVARTYSARVVIEGRALMTFEDDEWWCHGAEPGGISAKHKAPMLAFVAFKMTLTQTLSELSQTSNSFEAFTSAVEDFVNDQNGPELERWEAARSEIRKAEVLEAFFARLKRKPFNRKVTVERLEKFEVPEEVLALPGVA